MSTGITEAGWIWKDGEFVRWEDATVHLLSLAVQFGSSVFEGIRCYDTLNGPAIFRLDAHIRRLRDSTRIYRMPLEWSDGELTAACREVVRKNDLRDCYIRPMVLWGYGSAGLNPAASPIECYVAAWPWGTYLGPDALEEGVDVCVSTWQRAQPNTFPVAAKAAGHYNAAQLMKIEAIQRGFAEAIALGPGGLVSEGSGQNVFMVRGGTLSTPPLDGTNLGGITRDAVLTLAREMGIETVERPMPRESLYTADELFFAGTATEVTPIRSVDGVPVGEGRGGKLTLRIQRRFLDAVRGKLGDRYGWLTLAT
jgi:branched-chain amino acid aminotransferase